MTRLRIEERGAGLCHFSVGRGLRGPDQREAGAQYHKGVARRVWTKAPGATQRAIGLQDLGNGGARKTGCIRAGPGAVVESQWQARPAAQLLQKAGVDLLAEEAETLAKKVDLAATAAMARRDPNKPRQVGSDCGIV
jgi:hypothetical protein